MGAQRYQTLFARLQEKKEGAFIPFVMLGDPTPEASLEIIETLIASGADALELGIPFSDAVADGPVIQQAGNRALAAGVTPEQCLAVSKKVRERHPDIPVGLLVYANLVAHRDLNKFYAEAAAAGIDSVLVADVPMVSAMPFVDAAKAAGVAPIFVAPPNADAATIKEISRLGQGYTYFQGRAGVTGADKTMDTPLPSRIGALKEAGAPPVVIGFGISTPEHVQAAIGAGAAGAIAGSATVALIEKYLNDGKAMHAALRQFVQGMKAATQKK